MSDTLHTKITNIIARHGQVTKPMVDEIVKLVEKDKLKTMKMFGLKQGVKYDIKASDEVIVITPWDKLPE